MNQSSKFQHHLCLVATFDYIQSFHSPQRFNDIVLHVTTKSFICLDYCPRWWYVTINPGCPPSHRVQEQKCCCQSSPELAFLGFGSASSIRNPKTPSFWIVPRSVAPFSISFPYLVNFFLGIVVAAPEPNSQAPWVGPTFAEDCNARAPFWTLLARDGPEQRHKVSNRT